MEQLKTKIISIFGGIILFIGVIFLVLPGPAILFIPLGLAMLSFEYPIAKVWLKKYQRFSSKAARKTDSFIRNMKHRFAEYRSKKKFANAK
ncbi:PGPGW domain-containing protein [Thalassotalea fonticola]|uniref:PGPGW domain-containing protein n=1 Tax=Thalassotalea fonticola TaxID=3065649 RepID=A0ABZ0GJZ2_9GAMM|nr:PGPGW domain-containing protein [Colwelliaceae bacterium S1-1]